jgi:hypothetical protein
MSVASAMLKYGLLVDEGEGRNRQVKLTEDAIRLSYNPDKNSKEYQELLKKAALSPKIHAELWKKYGGIIPDDSLVKRFLVVDRKFNEQYVDNFIQQFKRTIRYAKLIPGDKVDVVEVDDDSESTTKHEKPAENLSTTPASSLDSEINLGDMFRKYMTEHNLCPTSLPGSFSGLIKKPSELAVPIGDWIARVPYPVAKEDFDLFIDTLKLWERKLVIPAQTKSRFPTTAIWKNAATNKPVKIIGEVGEHDGMRYFKAEDGAEIPENELSFA